MEADMKTFAETASYTAFLIALLLSLPVQATAEEVDFSCMEEAVRPIIQVTDAHQEFDVVMRNRCPGAVYWSVCIERMDPWSHEVIETHTPSGYVEPGKRARVNLQMKNVPRESLADGRIQAFYVNHAYGIEGVGSAACVARGCEAQKRELRAQTAANDKAWLQAEKRLAQRLEEECPSSGWGNADVDACRQRLRESTAEEIGVFANTDAALRAKLDALDPENCTMHGGGRNTVK
jgi:hypothetical protein